ncbi:MAG: PD-(D/E)XK motif protein [Solirubrobacterales bacterium]|nr:PD-(D/E)XK motif protein [Solirubrobacterales bacterium]
MTSLNDLLVGWIALAEKPTDDGHAVSTLALTESVPAGQVLLGRDLSGSRHLLIPAVSESVVVDESSAAVRIQALELGGGTEVASYVDLVCVEESLFDVFADLVIVILREAVPTSDPAAECAEVLARWREMLRPPKTEPLNAAQAAGLLAELMTVHDIVQLDPQRRIDMWMGPSGSTHDIRRADHALEVKATLSKGAAATGIHGLGQLAAPDGGDLHLVWMRFEQVPEGSLSVEGLITQLRQTTSSTEGMYRLLAGKGWLAGRRSHEITFELVERRVFLVDDSFPRLIPSMLTAGTVPTDIDEFRYRVLLENQTPLSDDGIEAAFRQVAISDGHDG